ncbi:MAG: hypothetical protein EOS36_27925 [Mesorhizobium sp.]|uniref:hypothetical protein n=1 Tax=Mesorhizobium sp. TaxID=1871066 RepID=UPI000FE613EF|nr:hypothetical protein [Mesorhizobium sp.]RWD55393.1 MAG: hypothetical protein EOS36_27925 [Mesorhizobium sp.]RWE49280.1 MAG: hypothetical protein EOS79_07640 [Mesorhizobium sp.]
MRQAAGSAGIMQRLRGATFSEQSNQMENLETAYGPEGHVAANDDTPVFDVANKNLQIAFEVDTTIPSAKATARRELAGLMATAPAVTVCRYKPPRGPNKWKPRKYAAANDNEVESNPLIEALRRDGRESDIPWVLRYRLLHEVVGASLFDDELDLSEEGINVENRSLRLSGKSFEKPFLRAERGGWTGATLSAGEISYREPRHTVKQRLSVGQRTNSADNENGTRTQTPLRLAKSEDERIARIDGEPILAALRAGMGELLHTFEDAALGQWTMTNIGERMGYKHKARSREAKILVYTAIDRLRDQWRLVDRQMAAEAAACDRRVEVRRNELAAAQARYLGRVA